MTHLYSAHVLPADEVFESDSIQWIYQRAKDRCILEHVPAVLFRNGVLFGVILPDGTIRRNYVTEQRASAI